MVEMIGELIIVESMIIYSPEIAWRRLGAVRNAARIRAWLVAIAANEARKIAQKSRRVR